MNSPVRKTERRRETGVGIRTPNPNPIPHISSDKRRTTKSKRTRGRRKGREKKPTRTGFSPAREKKCRAGQLLAGLGQGSPRPGRSTAACSPAGEHARRRGGRRRRRGSLLTPARCPLNGCGCAEVERRESGERRERRAGGEWPLGFGTAAGLAILFGRIDRMAVG